jgi:hypothetical protein
MSDNIIAAIVVGLCAIIAAIISAIANAWACRPKDGKAKTKGAIRNIFLSPTTENGARPRRIVIVLLYCCAMKMVFMRTAQRGLLEKRGFPETC